MNQNKIRVNKTSAVTGSSNGFYTLRILLILVLCAVAVQCGKPGPPSQKQVLKQLENFLNSQLAGTSISIAPDTADVVPLSGNRYRITLRHIEYKTDLVEIVNLLNRHTSSEETFDSADVTAKIDEVVFIYGPDENFIDMQYVRGLTIESPKDLQQAIGGTTGDIMRLKNFKAVISRTTFSDPEKESNETVTEQSSLQLTYIGKSGEDIDVLVEVEHMGAIKSGEEDQTFSDQMLRSQVKATDMQKLLDTGTAIYNRSMQIGKTKITAKTKNVVLLSGTIGNAYSFLFFQPEKSGLHFELGIGIGIKDAVFSVPGNKPLQLLSRMLDARFQLEFKHLDKEVAGAILDLTNSTIESRSQSGAAVDPRIIATAFKFIMLAIQSEVSLHFALSPFKHQLGELEAELVFQLKKQQENSTLTALLKLFNADEMMKRLGASGIVPKELLQQFSDGIKKYGLRQANGDVILRHQMDARTMREHFMKHQH